MSDAFAVRRGESTISGAAPNPITLSANGAAINLTGATVTARWRKGTSMGGEFAAATQVSPTVVDAATGKIALVFSASDTLAFEVGPYLWLVKVVLASGQVVEIPLSMTVLEGF